MKGLKIVLPSVVEGGEELRKLEHFYGIEFRRGSASGGDDGGSFLRMVGDEGLLSELRFHNQLRPALVKDGKVTGYLDALDWRKMADGSGADLSGSDGSDVMLVHERGLYAILGGTDPDVERFIVSDRPFTFGGDEAVRFGAFGWSPDYATVKDGKLRSIRDDSVVGTHGTGVATNISDAGYASASGGGFPLTGVSRFGFEGYARARNRGGGGSPYMVWCCHDHELLAALMFIEFRTKDLTSCLGGGISANYALSEETWGTETCVRVSSGGGGWSYATLGTMIDQGSSRISIIQALAKRDWGTASLLKVFEAQLGSLSSGSFESPREGSGVVVAGVSEGVMTGIWRKGLTFKIPDASLTAGGSRSTLSVEVVLRVPVWRGLSRLWGGLGQFLSGYDVLESVDGSGGVHRRLFRASSVGGIVTDDDVTVYSSEGNMGFESVYEDCGEIMGLDAGTSRKLALSMVRTAGGVSTCVGGVGGVSIGYDAGSKVAMHTYEQAVVMGNAPSGVNAGQCRRRVVIEGEGPGAAWCALRSVRVTAGAQDWDPGVGTGLRVGLS